MGVVNCNHIGRLGEYTAMAAEQGYIGLVTNTLVLGAPYGGKASASPCRPGTRPMLLVDFAPL